MKFTHSPCKLFISTLTLIHIMSCSNEIRPKAPELRQGATSQDATGGPASDSNTSENSDAEDSMSPPVMNPETPAATKPAAPPSMAGSCGDTKHQSPALS